MKVIYLTRIAAQKLEPNDSTAMISIRDEGYPTRLKEGWKNLLVLEFDDIDPQEVKDVYTNASSILTQFTPFSDFDAGCIKSFVEGLPKDIDTIYVHCHAGRSRSPAIAQVIAERFITTSTGSTKINPNKFVYNKLKEVWKQDGN